MLRALTILWLITPLLAGCAELTQGRWYQMAKVGRDQASLVPVHRVEARADDPEGYDQVISSPGSLGIVMNGGYLRYLESVSRPEVLIFVRVKIFPTNVNEKPVVWEAIYLQSEEETEQMILAKDAMLPRVDIPILPGFQYDDQDILVSIRIIELDQEDNERVRKLINVAAATAASFEPEAAASISVVQAVFNFLTLSNTDDIEFQFDFGLSAAGKQVIVEKNLWDEKESVAYDTLLRPRASKYVVVKSEYPDRLDYPNNYYDFGHEGVRFVLAQALKIGTLGFFNWGVWDIFGGDPDDDFYLRVLGRPFATSSESWRIPRFRNDRLTVDQRYQDSVVSATSFELRLDGTSLAKRAIDSEGAPQESSLQRPFTDQGYIILSVTAPQDGVSLETLKTAAASQTRVGDLVRTGQLSPDELAAGLQEIQTALVDAYRAEQTRRSLGRRLRSAEGPEDFRRIIREYQDQEAEEIPEALLDDLQRRYRRLGGQGSLTFTPSLLHDPFIGGDGESRYRVAIQVPSEVEPTLRVPGLTLDQTATRYAAAWLIEATFTVSAADPRVEAGTVEAGTESAEVKLYVLGQPGLPELPGSWAPGEEVELTLPQGRTRLQDGARSIDIVLGLEVESGGKTYRLKTEIIGERRVRVTNNSNVTVEPTNARFVLPSDGNRVEEQVGGGDQASTQERW